MSVTETPVVPSGVCKNEEGKILIPTSHIYCFFDHMKKKYVLRQVETQKLFRLQRLIPMYKIKFTLFAEGK